MSLATFDTRDLQVTSVFFRQEGNEVRFESFPKKLVYKGREYTLAEQ
jgi:hypothetical protein